MSERTLLLGLTGTQDHQFGASYELKVGADHLTAALHHDDLEQPLIARSLDLVRLCQCGVRSILEPVLLRREARDRQQRSETLIAVQRLELARAESRQANGLVERLRAQAAELSDLGKWARVSA